MQRPRVIESGMGVGIERPLLGQSRGRPVLPPVEIPLEPPIQPALVPVEVSGPGAPRLLIGALQVAEIVDLEARRAALEVCLEEKVIAAHLAKLQPLDVPRERGPRRIKLEARIRPLVVMRRVALRRGDRLSTARDLAEVDRTRELVPAAGEAMTEVRGPHVCSAVQIW